MIAPKRSPAVRLDALVSRGLIYDLRSQPEPKAFDVALAFLSSAPGRAVTTRAFISGAMRRAGKRMLAAGGEPAAVRNALKLVRTTWNYGWRLGLIEAAPDELPAIAASRAEPVLPTPEEIAARKATIHAARSEKEGRKKQAAAAAKEKRRGKLTTTAAMSKASSRRPAKRAK